MGDLPVGRAGPGTIRDWACHAAIATAGYLAAVAFAMAMAWLAPRGPAHDAARFILMLVVLSPVPLLGVLGIVLGGRSCAEEERASAGRCSGCGYELAGLGHGVCPECGAAVPA